MLSKSTPRVVGEMDNDAFMFNQKSRVRISRMKIILVGSSLPYLDSNPRSLVMDKSIPFIPSHP